MSQLPRWQQLEALFNVAVELDPSARSVFLDQSCQGDSELKSELESLLESSDRASGFLNKPILNVVKEIAHEQTRAVTPGSRLGRYTVLSKLGVGGMGEVFVAQDSQLKRKIALKVLAPRLTRDERALRRFEQEAQAASALNHPNILTIFEFAETDDFVFIASELVEGPTLRQKLATGPLELPEAIDIAWQTARALETAHAHGIVHRDIKPENLIVRPDGLVKLLDFGIAKLTEESAPESPRIRTTSQAGVILGTVKYMSPEQARGMQVDSRSDIYSLGAVLYEMLAGRPPFVAKGVGDLIAEILDADPPSLATLNPKVHKRLRAIVKKALAKDCGARYQQTSELTQDLLDLKNESEFRIRLREASPRTDAGEVQDVPVSGNATTRAFSVSGRFKSRLWRSPRFKFGAAIFLLLSLAGGYWLRRKPVASHDRGRARSLAVLPFRNLKPDPATDFLGFSLADAIITKLGYVSALTLRPSSAVDTYRNKAVDPRVVARDLKVDTLLTGTFVRDGEDLRITTQLIDARADKILWRDAIDVKYDKLPTLQHQLSQQIINGLELNLSPAESEHLKSDKPVDPLAYEYYLRGVDLYSLNDFAAAVKALEKAIEIQSDYAPMWAELGRAYTTTASLHSGGGILYRKAQKAYERALLLNPSLVEPRIYMGNLLTDTGRVEQAVPLLRAAIQAHPSSAEAHWELGYAYRFGGMLPESIAEAEQARGFDPEVKINSSALNSYLYLGQYDRFLQSLPANNSAYILFYRGFAEYHEKKLQQAAEDFDSAYELDPTLIPAQVGKALSYSLAHQNTRGSDLLRKVEQTIQERGVADAELLYKVAEAYAVLGDRESALRMLQRSIDGGFFCYPYFLRDPLLEGLRNLPALQRQMQAARYRHEEFRKKFF
jgi:serine/threonine protein kinase/TolB-like protein/Tfp pilus assembly protein PilF